MNNLGTIAWFGSSMDEPVNNLGMTAEGGQEYGLARDRSSRFQAVRVRS